LPTANQKVIGSNSAGLTSKTVEAQGFDGFSFVFGMAEYDLF